LYTYTFDKSITKYNLYNPTSRANEVDGDFGPTFSQKVI